MDLAKAQISKTYQKVIEMTDSLEAHWLPGQIKFYDGIKGFGFINNVPSHAVDVFIHKATLLKSGFPTEPREALAVEIQIENSPKGLRASAIRLPR